MSEVSESGNVMQCPLTHQKPETFLIRTHIMTFGIT